MAFPLAAVLPAIGAVAKGVGDFFASGRQMKFQERMRNTAYQAAVRDMRLAGINPMLAYMQGGAQSPGGSSFEVPDVAGTAVSTALQAKRLTAELKLLKAQEQLAHDQASGVDADNRRKWAQMGYTSMGDLSSYDRNRDQVRAEAEARVLSNEELRAMANFWRDAGKVGKGAQFGLPFLRLIFGR